MDRINSNAVYEIAKANEGLAKRIEELERELEHYRWIPVEERRPERPEENPVFDNKPLELYLVSVKNVDYAFRAFWNGSSFTDGWEKLEVLAWMPLPEPFVPQY